MQVTITVDAPVRSFTVDKTSASTLAVSVNATESRGLSVGGALDAALSSVLFDNWSATPALSRTLLALPGENGPVQASEWSHRAKSSRETVHH